jgi:hypothetical protein
MDYSSGRNHGCRIIEFTHRGLTMVTLENELLRTTILVDKGADITEIVDKKSDIDFMWRAPGGIRDTAKHIPTTASALGNNLDYYEGGWHESLPCGAPCTIAGAELGLHGEVALLPWNFQVEEDSANTVIINLSCRTCRFPFFLKKRIILHSNSPTIIIEETLLNESKENIEFMWGQHPTFGKPFLDDSCCIDVPAKTFTVCSSFNSPTSYFEPGFEGTWPLTVTKEGKKVDLSQIPPENDFSADLLYLKDLDEGWYAIRNQRLKLGFGLRWDLNIHPYIWYWKVFRGLNGYPWFGRTYNIGFEPWSSFPSAYDQAQANNRTLKIKGNEIIISSYLVTIFTADKVVKRITEEGSIDFL